MRKSINSKMVKSKVAQKMKKKNTKKIVSKAASLKTANKTATKKVDFTVIEQYLEFMELRGVNELEYSVPSLAIKLRRGGNFEAPLLQSHTTSQSASNTKVQASKEKEAPAAHVIRSPFVGTFYRAPGPNQEQFVEEGRAVGSGDVLCIIEAMKLMNEIESDLKGRIKKILVKDATPVEFGEPLFEIDPL